MNKNREIRKLIEEVELVLKKGHKVPFSQLALVNQEQLHNIFQKLNSNLIDYERLYDWNLSLTCDNEISKESAQEEDFNSYDTNIRNKNESLHEEMLENFETFKYQYQDELDKKFSQMQETLTEYVDNVLQDMKKSQEKQAVNDNKYAYNYATEGGSFYDSPNLDYSQPLEEKQYSSKNSSHKATDNTRNRRSTQSYNDTHGKIDKENNFIDEKNFATSSAYPKQDNTEDRMLNFINTEFLQDIK